MTGLHPRSARSAATLIVPLLLAACVRPAPAPGPPIGAGDATVREAMRAAAVPGLAVAYLRDCRVERVATYGVANADSAAPVTPATAFEAASLSKPVFVYLLMKMVDEGRVDLDAPISATLPYPRIADTARYAAITPRIALSHATGLPNWAGSPSEPDRTNPLEFAFAPGSAFRYSGEGYQLVQRYAERLAGRSLEQLFRASLGSEMPASIYAGAAPAGAAPAFAHDTLGSTAGGRPMRGWETGNAAFTLRTVVGDYARFVARVCSGEGLSAGARAEMLRPHTPVAGDEWGADPRALGGELAWALGWGTQTTGDRTLHFHWGDNGPFKAFVAFDAATGRGLVYFANGARGLELMETLAAPVVGSVRPIAVWLDV